jgi:hypothetical protein
MLDLMGQLDPCIKTSIEVFTVRVCLYMIAAALLFALCMGLLFCCTYMSQCVHSDV